MIKTLDRYILRGFITNYLICLGVLIGLYVVLDLFVNLDEFTEIESQDAWQTMAKIINYYGHNFFLYFAQLAGVIILLAACFTLGRFYRTNELTAVLASGTSLYRVAAPVLVAAVLMNGLYFLDQEFVIPRIADKLSRKHSDIDGKFSFAVWFQPDHDNALLSAAMFSPRSKEMRGMVVMQRDEEGRMTGIIKADRARWDEERRSWRLENGYRMTPGADIVTGATDNLGNDAVFEYVSDMTPKELSLLQATLWTSFLSLPQLEKLQDRYAGAGAGEFIKVKHKRMTSIFMNMILLCLGIPFFLNRERPSVLVAGGKCLLACGACYAATFVCQSVDLTTLGLDNPALPAWLPVLIFGPLAVVMIDGIKT